jgi:hypothetical protein
MRTLAVVLALCLAILAGAAWIVGPGDLLPKIQSTRGSGGFAAELVLTPDEAQFRRAWQASESPSRWRVIDRTTRGSSVAAMLLFTCCAPNLADACDVVADFALVEPNGRRMPGRSAHVWYARPPPRGTLQLGVASLTVRFDAADAPGTYTLSAVVTDRIAGRKLALSVPLNLE